jgi:predicted RNA binding protein YcfA (HicA-like mRNA interferase family)
MTRKEKRLERIRQNPKKVSFEELRQVLLDYGFVIKRSRGSHFVFDVQMDDEVVTFTVPYTKPYLKSIYVKEALDLIDQIIALGNNDEAEDNE